MNEIAILFVGRAPHAMKIVGVYASQALARKAAELFIAWPSGWAGNELIGLGDTFSSARVEVWQVLDAVPEWAAD
jgi:hypothetical protein